ncbi:rhodanese-related sulfurtransferase [Mechercharimyces sp. CAU 1602]|uniref:oxygen-dependent tRNA uridine(34) hydroxylase TrhO n=1 Tax=Mechercharimyces sp. CAU 1602 TaxID=2973933 RepID=UPI00216112C5|nr:rhodanese-related sulfurtransferase [Mechercharimyces sp. CAU 1602]MCS1351085.1 rhodanese-related sulfurtransferase [Mechercharimyces sp. CAU 1602]
MTEAQTYQILLYYKYVPIIDPEAFRDEQYALCEELGLKGRILVAAEGINGTVSGPRRQTERYMEIMHAHKNFADMPFKVDDYDGHAFNRLSVKVKKELVTFRFEDDPDPNTDGGKHLSPKEFYEHLLQDDVIVIDGRNDYEYEIGHFRGAIRPEVNTSRQFEKWIRENLADKKEKKIITYCTGGIRCEKITAFMKKEGFQDVAQLDGGIVSYSKDPEVKGKLFDGKCYVFDQRIAVSINQEEDKVIGKCHHCGQPCDRYINCDYQPCHTQHISCVSCATEHDQCCSQACQEAKAEERELNKV